MDFAANAVFDVIAPPTRTANARPAPASSGRSFDDHLERAAPPEAPEQPRADSAPSPETQAAAETAEPTAETAPGSETAAEASAAAEAPVPSLVVQIVQPAQPHPATAEDAVADAPVAAAGEPSPPQAPSGQTEDAGHQTQHADTADAAPVQGAKESGDAKTDQPQQRQQAAPMSAPPTVQPQAAVANAAPQAAPVSTPESSQIASVASAMQQAPTPVTRDAPQARATKPEAATAKADVPAQAKSEAPEAPQGKAAANATQSAPPQGGEAKATVTPAPAIQTQAPLPADTSATQTNALMQASVAPSHASQATSHIEHAARAAPASAQVAREIVRRFDGENTRFELRLDPAELGRVDVKLEVSRDHRVTAVVTADNPQALAELARHARELEQMLQSSGLELTDNGLSFDLRQGGDSDAEAGDGSSSNSRGDAAEPETQTAQSTARPLGFERWRGVRVDIMA